MKTVRPRPKAILALGLTLICTIAAVKFLQMGFDQIFDQAGIDKIATHLVHPRSIRGKGPVNQIVHESPVEVRDDHGNVLRKPTMNQSHKIDTIPKIPDQSTNLASGIIDHSAFRNVVKMDRSNMLQPSGTPPLINTTGYPRLYNSRFVPDRRIVHLDLKGAPPRVPFFEKFFRLIAKLGATGVLMEWEDMFPYKGVLTGCRNGNAYTEAEVKQILAWAREYRLEVIPLVQTFGHLEWVLKYEQFAHLREVDRYAQVICPSNPEAVTLVKTIIDQVMSLHLNQDNSTFFHMGADEAFQIGMCNKCRNAIAQNHSHNRDGLMLSHIKTISQYIKEKYNRRVLMWHDMLNNVHLPLLTTAKLGEYVEPVVWAYAEEVTNYIRSDLWSRFSQAFPYIWAASAFKGADGPDRYHSNLMHYMKNHFTWSQAMTQEHLKFKEFRGLILTGWQRFDHFAILCELLPVGMPSLAINLQIAQHGGTLDISTLKETSQMLECKFNINVNIHMAASSCQFPGFEIYTQIQLLKQMEDDLKNSVLGDYTVRGWLSPFNMVHNYSSAWYLDQVQPRITGSLIGLKNVARNLRLHLTKIFFEDTVDEFLFEYVDQKIVQLMELEESMKNMGRIRVFPRRPFQIRRTVTETKETTVAPRQQATIIN